MKPMTVEEIRHKNFIAAMDEWREQRIDKRQDNTDRAFALALGISESYLNQLKSKSSNIGPKTARRIETTLRKTRGWLDMIDTTMRPDETMLLSMYRNLSETGKRDIAGYMNYLMSRDKDPVKGVINTSSEFYFPPK